MDAAARLRQLVAPLAGVDERDLSPHAGLGGRLKTSIGRATLDAALRREFGLTGAAAYQAATFGELQAAVTGAPAVAPPPAPAPAGTEVDRSGAGGPGRCGIDVERIDSLPAEVDFWAAAFYQTHFTPGEVAYCVRQENPRAHFAARWCAKEAAKKSDPALAGLRFDQLEVAHALDGSVFLSVACDGAQTRLAHAVSLSHAADVAVAVVLAPGSQPPVAAGSAAVPPGPGPGRPVFPTLAFLLSVTALALAAWTAVR